MVHGAARTQPATVSDGDGSPNQFACARANHAAVAVNGFLYVLGGSDGGRNLLSSVQVAPLLGDGKNGPSSPRPTWLGYSPFKEIGSLRSVLHPARKTRATRERVATDIAPRPCA